MFKNAESQEICVEGFKKEFKIKLNFVIQGCNERNFQDDLAVVTGATWFKRSHQLIDPRRFILNFNQVSKVILEMGFLTPTASSAQEQ